MGAFAFSFESFQTFAFAHCMFQVEFAPDLCSRVTFVNFTVTRSSLQSQCLHQVLKAERPDVDEKHSDLLKLQGQQHFNSDFLDRILRTCQLIISFQKYIHGIAR